MTTENVHDDDFTAAFAEFTEPGGAKPAVSADSAPAEPLVEPTPSPAAETVADPVLDPAVEPVTEPVVEAAPEPAPVVDPYTALRAELDALKAAQAAQPAPAPVAEQAPAPEAPLYTADETAALAKYQEDWPDISKGEALLRRAEYKELVQYVFQQVEARFNPVLEYVQEAAPKTQYSEIVRLVPDYDEVRDKTLAWVDTQPAYLKAAYQSVTQNGSAADVADLISRFKKETGYHAVAPTAPAAPVAPALPPAAQKAAAKLAVVPTTRTGQTAGKDENDYDGSFAEFAEREEKQLRK